MIASELMQREYEGHARGSQALFAIAESLLPILSLGQSFEREAEAEVIEPIKGTLTVSF